MGDIALLSGFFELAETCFKKGKDFNSLLLFYSTYGDQEGLNFLLELAEAEGKYNVAYETAFLLALPERCARILLKSKRYAEAAMFAKSYYPSMIPEIIKEWGDVLKQNELLFIPENICESKEFKKPIAVSLDVYKNKIEAQLYNTERAPADEIELQRDRWYEDFTEGGGNADVVLKETTATGD